MNQDQRKFLIERVNKTFQNQKGIIEKEFISKPSLNNYLVAAFLDNTIQFNDIDILKQKIRKKVLSMGSGEVLISEKSFYGTKNKPEHECTLDATDLFVLPKQYVEELKKYNEQKELVLQKISDLEAQKDTILLKIQIGSNAVLDKLITQVDNLADLNIMNSQFLLSDAK